MGKALTVKAVEALKSEGARKEVPDGLVAGLYLVVQPTGRKSWAVRYRASGQTRKLTIGQWPGVDLSSARDLARKALIAVAEGRDPAAEKKSARQVAAHRQPSTDSGIDTVIRLFIERHVKANTRPSTAREMSRLLTVNVAPKWKGRRAQDISRQDVIGLLDDMIDRDAPVSANRALAVIRRMFNWAVERGMLETSPCERVRAPTPERARDRILDDKEIRALWRATERIGWPFGPLTQLLILTGQRRDEVTNLRWSELDFEKKLWIIPRGRVKNDRGHEVPLSSPAVAILQRLPRIRNSEDLVFSTTGHSAVSGFSRAKHRLDRIMLEELGELSENGRQSSAKLLEWRNHDLRRTVASGMARLGINLPVIEKVLNHSSGSFAGIVGIYQRHTFAEEKRAALDAWGQFIETLVRRDTVSTSAALGGI